MNNMHAIICILHHRNDTLPYPLNVWNKIFLNEILRVVVVSLSFFSFSSFSCVCVCVLHINVYCVLFSRICELKVLVSLSL